MQRTSSKQVATELHPIPSGFRVVVTRHHGRYVFRPRRRSGIEQTCVSAGIGHSTADAVFPRASFSKQTRWGSMGPTAVFIRCPPSAADRWPASDEGRDNCYVFRFEGFFFFEVVPEGPAGSTLFPPAALLRTLPGQHGTTPYRDF